MSPFLDIYGNELVSRTFSRAYPFVKISQLLINPVASKADLVLRRPRDALGTVSFNVLEPLPLWLMRVFGVVVSSLFRAYFSAGVSSVV